VSNKLKARAVAKIKADWLAGASLYDLAAEHGVGPKAIWYHVKDLKRENAPPRGRRRSIDYAKVAQLKDQGFRDVELAERFGVTRCHIHKVMRELRSERMRAAA